MFDWDSILYRDLHYIKLMIIAVINEFNIFISIRSWFHPSKLQLMPLISLIKGNIILSMPTEKTISTTLDRTKYENPTQKGAYK